MSELPKGWLDVRLGDIADVQLGKMLDRKKTAGVSLPYLRNINVRWGRVDTSDLLEMPFRQDELERFSVRAGDVLVCEGGEPGRAAVWRDSTRDVKYQKALHRVRLPVGFLPEWLVHQLAVDNGKLAGSFTGTTIGHLPREVLVDYRLRVAPAAEQLRIVEAVERYLSQLDEAVATLGRVQRNLKRYRASVLKSAVEGRLVPTEAELARAENRGYEPASELLSRILAERRRRWEESGRKGRYEDPVGLETSQLPELPEGWCWVTLDAIAAIQGGITKNEKRRSADAMREVPYLRVANVQRGYLDLTEVTTILATEAEIEALKLQVGDVLFNEGGDRDKLGRGWVWKGELAVCIHQNHVFRARLLIAELSSEFISWFGNTEGRKYFIAGGTQTTNLASINMTKLRGLPVPLPPLAEQRRITLAVEGALSLMDSAAEAVGADEVRLARLRQSVLKWAFEGKLADQDPSDEPASMLLERIKAERAAAVPAPKSRAKKPRAKVTR